MSDIFKDRHAKLGHIVLRFFPKVMQMILRDYITPKGLQKRFSKKDFSFVFTESEVVLMEKLPNMDDFTIEISYKILRFEFNMLDEPKCKWGNVPHDTEVDIADDIQRLINATNSIISIQTEEVTEQYSKTMLEKIKLMVTRIDSYLDQDALESMYNSLCKSDIDSISILQDLTRLRAVEEESLPDTESGKGERYSRLSIAVIETLTNILRDVIESRISASQLYQKCIPVLKYFLAEQQTNLTKLQHSNTYDSLDITLIYKLLRQFSLIPSPTNGWGSKPDKRDIKLEDDIERIRYYRNQIVHRLNTNIEKNEFDDYFDKFRDIGHRMDIYFNQKTNYERRIIGHRTCKMDAEVQTKYENAMKEIENIKLRFEKMPIKFYWGDSFDMCLRILRAIIKDEKAEGRKKLRLQIIFQNEGDVDTTIDILNSLKEEINEGLSGIEFIVATKGSLVLNVDLLLEMLATDEKLHATLAFFIEKILESITTSTTESIAMVVIFEVEYLQWNVTKTIGEPVFLEFDIQAELFETDNTMEEQLRKIAHAIFQHSNGGRTNNNMTATLLPICLENEEAYAQTLTSDENEEAYAQTLTSDENTTTTEESFIQAQTPVKHNFPVSVTLRQQLNIKMSENENQSIYSCVKIGNALAFTDYINWRLIMCNSDGTDIQHISLSYRPLYITKQDINNVAVSCGDEKIILIINISTGTVTSTIKTIGSCYGISYHDNNLYVIIDRSEIHVIDLTGIVLRTILLPTYGIHDILVDRDRLVCIVVTSIYCCSLDGKLIWECKMDKFQDLRRVTTDGGRNVYVTDHYTHTVIVVSNDGKRYKDIITKSDWLHEPWGIHFDKKENVLLVCNVHDGSAFHFDVKKKHE